MSKDVRVVERDGFYWTSDLDLSGDLEIPESVSRYDKYLLGAFEVALGIARSIVGFDAEGYRTVGGLKQYFWQFSKLQEQGLVVMVNFKGRDVAFPGPRLFHREGLVSGIQLG